MSVTLQALAMVLALLPAANYVSLGDDWRVQVPDSWTLVGSDGATFVLSRDGVGIQSLRGRCRSTQSPFANLDEPISSSESLLDQGQILAAGLLRSYAAYAPKLRSIAPVSFGEEAVIKGVRATIEYRNEKGVRQQVISAAFVRRDAYCRLSLQVPRVYFLERDLSALEELIASLRRR